MIRVWYHGNCYDGFGAAWVAWKKFGGAAEYVPCFYGKEMPEHSPGDEVYILDFSFPRDQLIELAGKCSVLVLDHHKSAEEALRGLDFCQFDMDRSGAGMAWDYFFPQDTRPPLINAIEDRDLWRFRYKDTKAIQAYLRAEPMDFGGWSAISHELWDIRDRDRIIRAGEAIARFTARQVELICGRSGVKTVRGVRVAHVNATSFFSEVCHELLQKYPEAAVAMCYGISGNGVSWSLRSRGDFDVADWAAYWGGGGHKSAAGMKTATIIAVLGGSSC